MNISSNVDELQLLASSLDVDLPQAYVDFLRAGGGTDPNGFPLLGLPVSAELSSAFGATMMTWVHRPDLYAEVVTLRFDGSSAICLELDDTNRHTGRVIAVDLEEGRKLEDDMDAELKPPTVVCADFSDYVHSLQLSNRVKHLLAAIEGRADHGMIEAACAALDVQFPSALQHFFLDEPDELLADLCLRLDVPHWNPVSLSGALQLIDDRIQPPPGALVPIMPLDDQSYACFVCQDDEIQLPATGSIVRLHLGLAAKNAQYALIDTNIEDFLETARAELGTRESGLERIETITNAFAKSHGKDGRQPKVHELRPVRLAVQNVIVGLAAFRHDRGLDALDVQAWQTCQAAHVGVHEGNRGLAAITLAEAFRAGGTMEIRSPHHPEHAVPASLRQYGRTQGISLGQSDPKSISPAEARELFLAVSQIPEDLRLRVERLTESGVTSPERAYFTLMSGIWSAIELDFIIGVTTHAPSILKGGVDPLDRPGRQIELGVCRAALMLGMIHRRISQSKPDSEDQAWAIEDDRYPIDWRVLPDSGAVEVDKPPGVPLPWVSGENAGKYEDLTRIVIMPRPYPAGSDVEIAVELQQSHSMPVVILHPNSTKPEVELDRTSDVIRANVPDDLPTLDKAVDGRLFACKVGRS